MTLLTVVQDASDMLMQPRNAIVFGGSDPEAKLFTVLLKQVGRDLVEAHDWTDLQATESFTCGSSNAQTSQPATGFLRLQSGTEMWNNTRDQVIKGPTSSQEWSELIVRVVSTYPQRWRIINGDLHIYAPESGDTIRYEYVHNKWVYQAGSTSSQSASLSADSDTFIFDEQLLTLGLVWRWKKAKGFDYAEEMLDYGRYLESKIRNDRGGTVTISTDRPKRMSMPGQWPGSISEYSG
jgi:hypothetical protein